MIIKCPECGHQVSDKAPVCPSCGVEIAGHIIKCSNCGELYLKEDIMCPNCHHTESGNTADSRQAEDNSLEERTRTTAPPPHTSFDENTAKEQGVAIQKRDTDTVNTQTQVPETDAEEEPIDGEPVIDTIPDINTEQVANADLQPDTVADKEESKKSSHVALIVSLLIAVMTAAILLFFYKQGTAYNEKEEYTQAIASNEPSILQSYLENFPAAPKQHRNAISLRLKALQSDDQEWASAVEKNSKEEFMKYLSAHPNSPHRNEILAKMDEMDWAQATAKDDEDAYLGYKAQHPKGIHGKEADEKLKTLLAHTVSAEEQSAAVSALRQLLQGMNSKNRDKITAAVSSSINFMGSSDATAKDIIKYMTDRLYQADVKTINWHLSSPAEVSKESNDADTELKVRIPASLEVDREGGKSKRNYIISATVKSGKITQVNWTQTQASATNPTE